MSRRLHALVSGRVQRVGFRYYVADRAASLRLVGFVRNLSGGTVEVVAEGPRGDLETLLTALRTGPPAARITNVQVSWAPGTGEFHWFETRAGQ